MDNIMEIDDGVAEESKEYETREVVQDVVVKGKTVDKESWPWVEKYRPNDLSELVSHQDIISTLTKLIEAKKLPHLLFYGPPGTGKTSTILALAKKLFGNNYGSMVLELNASDDRGIDVVRDQIKEFAGTRKLFSKGMKLIILDEADAMTNDAQFSLRRVMEKHSKNARFCLICNYVGNIIPALQSRCTRFRFAPLAQEQIFDRLKDISCQEKLNVTSCGYEAILKLSHGDMRRVLNILQATSMAYDLINQHNVYLCTGNPLPSDIERIVNLLLNESYQESFQQIYKMAKESGYALTDILNEVYDITLQIDFPSSVRIYLYDQLAQLEHRLAFGTSEELQLASFVGIFAMVRYMLQNETSLLAP